MAEWQRPTEPPSTFASSSSGESPSETAGQDASEALRENGLTALGPVHRTWWDWWLRSNLMSHSDIDKEDIKWRADMKSLLARFVELRAARQRLLGAEGEEIAPVITYYHTSVPEFYLLKTSYQGFWPVKRKSHDLWGLALNPNPYRVLAEAWGSLDDGTSSGHGNKGVRRERPTTPTPPSPDASMTRSVPGELEDFDTRAEPTAAPVEDIVSCFLGRSLPANPIALGELKDVDIKFEPTAAAADMIRSNDSGFAEESWDANASLALRYQYLADRGYEIKVESTGAGRSASPSVSVDLPEATPPFEKAPKGTVSAADAHHGDNIVQAGSLRSSRSRWSSSTSETTSPPKASTPDSADMDGLRHPWDRRFEVQPLIEDITALVVKRGFGIDLEHTSDPSAARLSVKYCLEELAAICFAEEQSKQHPLDIFETTAYQNPSSGPTSSGSSESHNTGCSSYVGSSKKRKQKFTSGDDRQYNAGKHDNGDDNSDREDTSLRPRRRTENKIQVHQMSCPYRKRNKKRFNMRSHFKNCAVQPHPNMASLKRHILNFHVRKTSSPQFSHHCVRCYEGFASQDDVLHHIRLPPDQMCLIRVSPSQGELEHDPEDGVAPETVEILRNRKTQGKVSTWHGLWQTLFRQDTTVPSSEFVPPLVVELEEIEDSIIVYASSISQQIAHAAGQALDSAHWTFGLDKDAVAESIHRPICEALQEDLRKWLAACREEMQATSESRYSAKTTEVNLLELDRELTLASAPALAVQRQLSDDLAQEEAVLPHTTEQQVLLDDAMVMGWQQHADETGPAFDTNSYDNAWILDEETWL